MLTPQDVKSKEFTKAFFGGYDMAAVDEFLETLVEDYSSLYKENAILKNKLKVLFEKVEEYRSTEDAMRMALLSAQKMSKEIVDEAESKSKNMVQEAETAARSKIEDLRIELRDEELRLEAARKKTADFVSVSDEICKRHLDFLSNINNLIMNNDKNTESEKPNPGAPSEQENKLEETARTIEDSVAKIYENTIRSEDAEKDSLPDAFTEFEEPKLGNMQEDEFDEGMKIFAPVSNDVLDAEDDDGAVSAKSKNKFKNLQFGSNYEQNK